MPLQPTPPALTPAVLTVLAADMQTNIDLLTALNINLTKGERSGAATVADNRLPFMVDYFGNKNDYPNLKPTFLVEADGDAHWAIAQALANVELKAYKMIELVTDIRINSEHFAYKYGLEGYAVVGRAVEQNVPGADTFYDLLKRHFAQAPSAPSDGGITPPPAGNSGPPPAPPPPPRPEFTGSAIVLKGLLHKGSMVHRPSLCTLT